ncbi:uncharacterized protein [Periplaneta americana]|uniref:uncharacterized protein n=1 Tax=Periplaneta americana TaxID=6978 RepID=UPI0037E79C05
MLIKKEKRKMNEDFSDTDDESLTDNEKCTGNLQSDSNKSESKEKIKTEIPSLLESETYRPVEVDFEVDLNNLTEDEELWMVQCPVSLNPKTLKNKVFFVESSEFIFKVEDQKYSVTTNIHKIPPITCVTPSEEADCFRANILKPVGLMVIKEDLEVPEIAFTSTTKQRKRPNSSRVRHPLFGGDYEDELDIRRRLTSYSYAVDREIVIPSKKKKKKKKKDKKNVLEEEQKNNGIELKCISPGHSQSNALSEQGVDSAEKPKKKKKKMN